MINDSNNFYKITIKISIFIDSSYKTNIDLPVIWTPLVEGSKVELKVLEFWHTKGEKLKVFKMKIKIC